MLTCGRNQIYTDIMDIGLFFIQNNIINIKEIGHTSLNRYPDGNTSLAP